VIFNAEGYAFPDYQKRTAHIWTNLMTRETAHWNMILKHTSSRRLALDFGGHVGGTAIKFAQEFDNVVSFEPVPALYECLEHNTKDIDNIQIHNTGISNRSGSANIWVNPSNPGSNVIENHQTEALIKSRWYDPNREGFNLSQQVLIDVNTIDSYSFDNVDFIKMDTEGYIMEPLYGMKETLERCKPLIMIERAAKTGCDEQQKWLSQFGYRRISTIGIDDFFV